MIFQIPEDLTVFTVAALNQKMDAARDEYNTILASMKADTSLVSQTGLAELNELKKFTQDAQAEIDARSLAAQQLAEHAAMDKPAAKDDSADDGNDAEPDDDADDTEGKAKGKEYSATPRVGDIAPQVPAGTPAAGDQGSQIFGRMFAAANVDGYAAGAELPTLMDLTKAFISKTRTFDAFGATNRGGEPVHFQVATLTRDYPADLSVFGNDSDDEVLRKVTDEFALPGGNLINAVALRRQALPATADALTAATGWCAPSETLYTTCFQGTIDGLIDVPEVQARRGGIRHNQGIEFSGVYGAGTGFFNLSEAQVIAGTTKTCIEIPCPSFIDDRLGVTGLCITGNILQNRGYPEFVRDWMRAAMVVSAHQINSLQIAAMVADSTVVDLITGAPEPWASDASVTSQILGAIEMAIVDIKYRLRMDRNATLDVVLPWWVLAQFRADLSRRNTVDLDDAMSVTDAMITKWFTLRGARPQFVLDWQDSFAPTDLVGPAANAPGSATPIKALPTGVKFLVYPTGTWVRAVSDVITLNAIYDSTKLATNQLTQLFTETGWKMMRMCPLSRLYSINICPTGATGAQRAVGCVTP